MGCFPWWIEALAALFGIISTYLYSRGKYISFIFALVNTLPFTGIFLAKSIYAQALIHIYYSIMNFIGFSLWYRGRQTNKNTCEKKANSLVYHYLTSGQRLIYLLYMLGIFMLLLGLYRIFPLTAASQLQILDTLSTAMAIIAMFLGVRKCLDSWYWWLSYDVISIILSLQSQLYFAALQFLLYILIGIYGWHNWHKQYTYQNIGKSNFSKN